MTLCLSVGPLEHIGYKNTLLLHGVALKKFCGEMSQEYGIAIDTTFLENFIDQRWWFLEVIPDI